MNKQAVEFAVITRNGIVIQIGRSVFCHPKVNYKEKRMKWFDDSKLVRRAAQT